jgi:hypothetical protein
MEYLQRLAIRNASGYLGSKETSPRRKTRTSIPKQSLTVAAVLLIS